jgi:hypothetical protein
MGIDAKVVESKEAKKEELDLAPPASLKEISSQVDFHSKEAANDEEIAVPHVQEPPPPPSPVRVPKSDRRGLLSSICLVPEVENPYHYSYRTKWSVTFAVAFAAATTTLGSASILRKPLA